MSKRDEFPPESGAPRAEAVSDKKPKYPTSNTPRSFWPKYTEDSSKRRVKLIAKSILIEVLAIGREGKIYSWKRKSNFNPHRSPRQLIGLWIASWRHHYGFSNKQRQSIINIIELIQNVNVGDKRLFVITNWGDGEGGVVKGEGVMKWGLREPGWTFVNHQPKCWFSSTLKRTPQLKNVDR